MRRRVAHELGDGEIRERGRTEGGPVDRLPVLVHLGLRSHLEAVGQQGLDAVGVDRVRSERKRGVARERGGPERSLLAACRLHEHEVREEPDTRDGAIVRGVADVSARRGRVGRRRPGDVVVPDAQGVDRGVVPDFEAVGEEGLDPARVLAAAAAEREAVADALREEPLDRGLVVLAEDDDVPGERPAAMAWLACESPR
ncbi:MAG: hypothetical protein U0167_08140 [bacterium]